jgi:hypothetical protein
LAERVVAGVTAGAGQQVDLRCQHVEVLVGGDAVLLLGRGHLDGAELLKRPTDEEDLHCDIRLEMSSA